MSELTEGISHEVHLPFPMQLVPEYREEHSPVPWDWVDAQGHVSVDHVSDELYPNQDHQQSAISNQQSCQCSVCCHVGNA